MLCPTQTTQCNFEMAGRELTFGRAALLVKTHREDRPRSWAASSRLCFASARVTDELKSAKEIVADRFTTWHGPGNPSASVHILPHLAGPAPRALFQHTAAPLLYI